MSQRITTQKLFDHVVKEVRHGHLIYTEEEFGLITFFENSLFSKVEKYCIDIVNFYNFFDEQKHG